MFVAGYVHVSGRVHMYVYTKMYTKYVHKVATSLTLHTPYSPTSEKKVLQKTNTVGIQLPETSSYRTFSCSLTEWSRDKADHSVNKLFVCYSGHHSVTGQKVR